MKSEKYDDFEKYIRQSLESSFEEDGLTVSDELFSRTLSAIREIEAEKNRAGETGTEETSEGKVEKNKSSETDNVRVLTGTETVQGTDKDRAPKKKIYRLVYAASGIAAAVLLAVIGIGIVSGNNRMKSSDTAMDSANYSQTEAVKGSEAIDSVGAMGESEMPMAINPNEYLSEYAPAEAAAENYPEPSLTMAPSDAGSPEESMIVDGRAQGAPEEPQGSSDVYLVEGEGLVNPYPSDVDVPVPANEEDLTAVPDAVGYDPSGKEMHEAQMGEEKAEGELDKADPQTGNTPVTGTDAIITAMTGVAPEDFTGNVYMLYESADGTAANSFRQGVEDLSKTGFDVVEDDNTEIEQFAGGPEDEVKGSIVIIFNGDLGGTVYYIMEDETLYVSEFDSTFNLGKRSGYYVEDAEDMEALLSKIEER